MKNIAMLLVAGCAVGMLTGCGIPEEEHNMMIAQLEEKQGKEVDKLKGDIADKESIIENEKKKVRKSRIELDDATDRIKDLQQKSALVSKELATEKAETAKLAAELKTAKSQVADALDRATDAEEKYSTLDVEYQEVKRRFEMFKKNMSAMSAPAAAPAEALTETPAASEEAPKSEAQKASSLLDQMGTL